MRIQRIFLKIKLTRSTSNFWGCKDETDNLVVEKEPPITDELDHADLISELETAGSTPQTSIQLEENPVSATENTGTDKISLTEDFDEETIESLAGLGMLDDLYNGETLPE